MGPRPHAVPYIFGYNYLNGLKPGPEHWATYKAELHEKS
jgi:hypothetical protein